MPRLPKLGQDSGTWGQLLNDFLSVELNSDGTLKKAGDIAAAASNDSVVHNSSDETIGGVKTFSSSPIVPTPTLSTQATNKAYVDSTVSAGASDATTTAKGIVKLAGDLAGTALLPTVPGLAAKEPTITAGTTAQYYRGDKSFQILDKTAVGLTNVDNTSDNNKPVSNATTTALNLKIDKSITTTKGDLLAATAASTIVRLAVGTDGQILTADAASAPGVKWAAAPTAPVTSVVGQTGVITGAQIAADPALTATYGYAIVNATGVAATDTAAIQAAHDALPANGGEIRLGAGTFLLTSTGLSFTKSVKLIGQGKSAGAISVAGGYSADKAITRIEYPFGTGNAISIAANACIFQDFHLINTTVAAPTAGAGIVVTSGGVGFEYRSISVSGFYRNIDHGNGFEWYMSNCTLFDFVFAGLRIANPTLPDGGDMGVVNCQIMAGPNRTSASYGIEWRSAGGLRVIGCKFNKRGTGSFTIGILLNPVDGIQTGVFEIVGNSFENMAYGVYSDDSGVTGTGNIAQMVISSNEFYTTTRGIIFQRAATGHLTQVVIASNMFRSVTATSTATGGITLKNMDTVSVSNNMFKDNIQEASRIIVQTGVTNLSTTTIVQTGQTIGTAVLNGTTPVVVTSGVVTASSVIQLTQQTAGGTQSGIAYVVSRVAGTSFTIASVAGDTSVVGWQITESR